MIAFSESSLRYFLFNLGYNILSEYMEVMPDHEDDLVLEAMIHQEMFRLRKAMKEFDTYETPQEEPLDNETEG